MVLREGDTDTPRIAGLAGHQAATVGSYIPTPCSAVSDHVVGGVACCWGIGCWREEGD